jgi:hypothetical protein
MSPVLCGLAVSCDQYYRTGCFKNKASATAEAVEGLNLTHTDWYWVKTDYFLAKISRV